MSNNIIKGIGHIRVSTKRQGRTVSLPSQRATIQEYAVRAGIDLIAVYSDDETGTTLDRPRFPTRSGAYGTARHPRSWFTPWIA